jgi:peptidoglycan L-alanyl-D-glutamate endopeptidase CwlK
VKVIDTRNLSDLHPKVREMAEAFEAKAFEEGIPVIITSTYRDFEAQNALYAQGRTKPGKIVTNAKGGQSFHNFRVAFDFVPLRGKKPVWGTSGADGVLWERCGKIAESVGLEWAGWWKSFKEMAHCQYTGGLTLKDFQAGKTLEP